MPGRMYKARHLGEFIDYMKGAKVMVGKKEFARMMAGVLVAGAMGAGSVAPALAQTNVVRLCGPTRYDTMSEIASASRRYSTYAVLATGESFPDALCASALAGALDAPVILTGPDTLSPQARSRLASLGVSDVYLMGGEAAVSEKVERQVTGMGINVTRVSGADRQQTSIEALAKVREAGSCSHTAIVATADTFADALSVGPWAYLTGSPILLTAEGGLLPEEAVRSIIDDPLITDVLIVGGTKAVGAGVEEQLSGMSVVRIGEADRYLTSRAIAEWAQEHGLGWKSPAVATGSDFPDALSGSALCGTVASPLLLVSDAGTEAADLLASHAADIDVLYVLGGPKAVGEAAEQRMAQALGAEGAALSELERYVEGWHDAWLGTAEDGRRVVLLRSQDGCSAVLYVARTSGDVSEGMRGALRRSGEDERDWILEDADTHRTLELSLSPLGADGGMTLRIGGEEGVFDLEPTGVAEALASIRDMVGQASESLG